MTTVLGALACVLLTVWPLLVWTVGRLIRIIAAALRRPPDPPPAPSAAASTWCGCGPLPAARLTVPPVPPTPPAGADAGPDEVDRITNRLIEEIEEHLRSDR